MYKENKIEIKPSIIPIESTELMNINFREVFYNSENPMPV
jgi:hypothetical protein